MSEAVTVNQLAFIVVLVLVLLLIWIWAPTIAERLRREPREEREIVIDWPQIDSVVREGTVKVDPQMMKPKVRVPVRRTSPKWMKDRARLTAPDLPETWDEYKQQINDWSNR